jgi:hypothetical protein
MSLRPSTARLLAATALCLSLPLSALANTDPLTIDANFKPAAQAALALDLKDNQALKGLRRLALTQVNLEFVTLDSVSAQTSGFGSAGRASATGIYKLVGAGEPEFQALAEALHAALQKQLRDAGIEVVAQEQVSGAPTWRKLVATGTPLPERSDRAVVVGLPGGAQYGVSRLAAATKKTGLLDQVSAIGAGFAAVGNASDNLALQQELGGAALAELTLRVHFAQLSNHNRGFFGRLSDQAKVSARVHPIVTHATLAVQAGATVSTLELKQPLLLDPESFVELRQQAKTAGDVAGAVAVGLLRLAIGSKDSHSAEAYEAVTEPARYRERVGAGLASVGELLVARLAAER